MRLLGKFAAVVAGISLVSVTSCGNSESPTTGRETASPAASAIKSGQLSTNDTQFNMADIAFVRDMIPHHEQAVELSALVSGRTTNPKITALAAAITSTQSVELGSMRKWLTTFEKRIPAPMASTSPNKPAEKADGMEGMDHGAGMSHEMEGMSGDSLMSGMASPRQIQALKASKDEAFVDLWLKLMIAHHEGALSMANVVKGAGSNTDVLKFAAAISEAQKTEIIEMKKI